MDKFWKRLGKSIVDVAWSAESWRAGAMKVLTWLALAGASASAIWKPSLLPPTLPGKGVWILAIAAALALGVQAAYRHRVKLEAATNAKLDARRKARYEASKSLARVVTELDLYRQVLQIKATGELEKTVAEFGKSIRKLHPLEAPVYERLYSKLRLDLKNPGALIQSLPELTKLSFSLLSKQKELLEDFEGAERELLASTTVDVLQYAIGSPHVKRSQDPPSTTAPE